MRRRIYIKDAILVNEGHSFVGSLIIDGDRIGEILPGEGRDPEIPVDSVVEGTGCCLLPGIIDTHVHFREPGLTYKAGFEAESRAAAAGGVTTFFDMPNTLPQTTTWEAFCGKAELAAKSHVNYGLFFGATNANAKDLPRLNRRKVCGIKLFMGASTGGMLVEEESVLRDVFAGARLPIVAHCEDSSIIARNMKRLQGEQGADPDVKYHPVVRSEEACYESSRLAVGLAREYGARLHVAHISTAKELELFPADDSRVTAEVCVPHLIFTDEDYARLGTRIKCNPAIKSVRDRAALREALTNGKIRTIATDHAPHRLWEKAGGAARAVSGMPMVQFSLVSMLGLVDEGVLGIERMVELMCHNPARLFDVENRGFLREGYKADLVLVRLGSPWTLTPNRIESKCNWSPLEGRTFGWRVEQTYCNGFLVYNKGHITDDNFHGQAVTFNR